MRRESIDTNVLLRLVLNDVPEQHALAKKLITIPNTRFDVADLAMVEFIFALDRHYQMTRMQIFEVVRGAMAISNINCNRPLFESALGLYVRCPALSIEDCCLSAYAGLNEAVPLWTFDKKLARQSETAKELR
ncbi:MAG: PIN domain-containing protein [Candidatus Nomurabacteria bacterium]|jgi:predicted nucleic-acid-binding protein|nr:PIN domain-containing protein [Candidatus Nomurabacteria bacterium]